MGYETLIDTLLKEGERKSRELLEKAAEESGAILREARERVSRLQSDGHKMVGTDCQNRRATLRTQARRNANLLMLKAKNEAVETVLRKAQENLKQWENDPTQREAVREFWTRRVEETLGGIPSRGVRVYLHEGTPNDLERKLIGKGVVCERVADPMLWFGFRISFENGRKTLTDSFQGRLNKIKPEVLVRLYQLLFQDDRSEPSL